MTDEDRATLSGNRSLIRGLHAVVLIAADYDAQVRFYSNVLNLEIRGQYDDATFFNVGDQILAIFARSHHPEGTSRLGGADHGISHLEFLVDHEDENRVEAVLEEAEARAYRDVFQDADGNLFHFVFK